MCMMRFGPPTRVPRITSGSELSQPFCSNRTKVVAGRTRAASGTRLRQ